MCPVRTPAWTQSFSYDGFGNLTSKTLNGTTTGIPVDSVSNRLKSDGVALSNVNYDSNGNLTSLTSLSAPSAGLTLTYDAANRVASARVGSDGTEYYGYDASNRRIYVRRADGSEEWTMYGARGERLGTYSFYEECNDPDDPTDCYWVSQTKTSYIWFGSKLIWSGSGRSASGPAFTDRLGTNRASGARFYPYGDEITSTGNDRVKFGTYKRDASTGLDYADQRYYASSYGRFNTPDTGPAHLMDPGTMNRYSYTAGDPVNRNDPRGLCVEDENGNWWDSPEMGGGSYIDNLGDANCTLYQSWLDNYASAGVYYNDVWYVLPPVPTCYDAGNSSGCGGGGQGGDQGPAPGDPGGGSPRQNRDLLQGAVDQALKDLLKPDCAQSVFGGGIAKGHDPAEVLQDMMNETKYGSIKFDALPSYAGAVEFTTGFFKKTATIDINTYNDPSKGIYWNAGNVDVNAITLLHELGHAFNGLFGKGSSSILFDANKDGTPNAAAEAYNADRLKPCN